jgi:hypothetical protein
VNKNKNIKLQTRQNIVECRKRLQENPIARYKINQFDLGFRIGARDDKFKISKINQLPNIFRPVFSGILQSDKGKTKISGNFHMMLFVKLFFGLLLGAGILVTILIYVHLIPDLVDGIGPPLGIKIFSIFFPLIWLGIVSSIIVFGRWLSKNDRQEIIGLLDVLLKAKQNEV